MYIQLMCIMLNTYTNKNNNKDEFYNKMGN
jgi:hypothetical protein